MKKIQLLAMVIPLFFACAPDSPVTTVPVPSYLKTSLQESSNPVNPYDYAGALRNRILGRALSELPKGLSESELLIAVKEIAETDSEFQSLKTSSFTPLSLDGLQGFLQSTSSISQSVNTLPLSQKAKEDYTAFSGGLLSLKDGDFESIHNYIIGFESGIINSTSYSQQDKRILLTATAIERYSNHYRKKPKDKDWDLLIGNIMAGAEGATYDTATAVLNSVSVEVALHGGL
jgi:hypothetical protein